MLIGVLGAGQLGRMLALAGVPLGLRFRFLDPSPGSPAGQLAEQIVASYDDAAALACFAAGLDAITYEFENVPVVAARALERHAPVLPPPVALEVAQDRLGEKQFFQRLGIPTAPFAPVDDLASLTAALGQIGTPALLKTRRLGYDGKGQLRIDTAADADAALAALGGQPLILEGHVPFARELSLLAARARSGELAIYPLVENVHRGGILRRSLAPAPGVDAELQALAHAYGARVLAALDYVGVLAIELFEVVDGAGRRLLANELAPRVHNSGHWTIEGAATSQFENHLRAVAGLPLGATAMRGCAAMLNLIGRLPEPARVLAVPEAHLHLYGKAPRPGRKLGHVTLRADDQPTLLERVAALSPHIPEE